MKRILACFFTVSGSFLSTNAFAALTNINGYICSAMYTRQNNVSFGQGFVQVQISSAAKCTGSILGTFYYLGANATINGFQFSEAERLGLFDQANRAAASGQRVNLFVESNGGGIFHTTYFAN